MDESFYSQLEEMELLDDYNDINKKAPTMNFIPNVEKSMDMLGGHRNVQGKVLKTDTKR